jgi:hypothetical protein
MSSRVRKMTLLAGLGLGVAASLGGCARHVHHHHGPDRVVVLEKEHGDRSIVIVHRRPRAGRHCWAHEAHWHCRGPR